MRSKRSIAMLLVILLTALTLFPSNRAYADVLTNMTKAKDWPSAPSIESGSAILIDAKTGTILYQKKANKACYPASITKVMTALLVLENCSLDETVTFSYRATHELEQGSTTIARTEGEEMPVEECLYALLLQSANEVAQGLAEHVSGSIEEFVVLMNERAKELGCTKTHFTNPSGLNDEQHYTTCHDMALILQAASKNEDFLRIESVTSHMIPPTNKHDEETPIAQKHALVKNGPDHYDGALAGKTGYTTIAGHTLVTYAARDDMELVCVIMQSEGTHYADTVTLLNYGFNNFSMQPLADRAKQKIRKYLKNNGGSEASEGMTEEDWEYAYMSEDSFMLYPNTFDYENITANIEILNEKVGETEDRPLARIQYMYEDYVMGSGTLYRKYIEPRETVPAAEESTEVAAEEPSQRIGILDVLSRFVQSIKSLQIRISEFLQRVYGRFGAYVVLGALAIFLLILIVLIVRFTSNRRKKKYYGPHFTTKPRRRRGKNKYHMK